MILLLLLEGLIGYTVVAGVLTVSGIYFFTRSGLYTLVTMAIGLLLVVLGGGAGGKISASTAEGAEEADISGMMTEDMQLQLSTGSYSVRAIFMFYGLGLFLWGLVVIMLFTSGLQ